MKNVSSKGIRLCCFFFLIYLGIMGGGNVFGQKPDFRNCTPSNYLECNRICNPEIESNASCGDKFVGGLSPSGGCFCNDFVGWSCLFNTPDYNNYSTPGVNQVESPEADYDWISGCVFDQELETMTSIDPLRYGESFSTRVDIEAGQTYKLSFYVRTLLPQAGVGYHSNMDLLVGFSEPNNSIIATPSTTTHLLNSAFLNTIPNQTIYTEQDVPSTWKRVTLTVQPDFGYDYIHFIPSIDFEAYTNCCNSIPSGDCNNQCDNYLFISYVTLDEVSCCDGDTDFDYSSYAFDSPNPTVWTETNNPLGSSPVKIEGFLKIAEGSDLTIEGMTFEFGLEGVVNVQPSARLNLVNCTFTGNTECQTMWQGIRSLGPGSGVVQTPENAAKVTLNGTLVEHAVVGLSTMDIEPFDMDDIKFQESPDITSANFNNTTHITLDKISDDSSNNIAESTSGGTANATNGSEFSNCFYGFVSAFYFNKQQLGSVGVNGVTFSSTGLRYPFNAITDQTEAGVFGLELKNPVSLGVFGCTFEDVKTGVFTATVETTTVNSNQFNDCRRGVYFMNTNNANSGIILLNNFEDCLVGVQADVTEVNIFFNDFNGTGFSTILDQGVGVLIRGCDFIVGSNVAALGNTFENLHIGVVAYDSVLKDPTFIVNNDFDSVRGGIAAGGKNGDVEIRCNNFTNYSFGGIGVFDWNNTVGELGPQGLCIGNFPFPDIVRPAANTFNQAGSDSKDIFIDNNANPFDYYDFNAPLLNVSSSQQSHLFDCVEPSEDFCNGLLLPKSDIDNLPNENEISKEVMKWYYHYIGNGEKPKAIQMLEDYQNEAIAIMKKLLPHKLQQGDLAAVIQMISNLSIQDVDDSYFYDYYNLLTELELSGRTIYMLTPIEENLLYTISQANTSVAYNAKTIFYLTKGDYPSTTIPTFPISSNKNQRGEGVEKAQIHPNPANKNVSVQYELEENEEGILRIYDLNGKQYQEIKILGIGRQSINIENYKNGIYLYTLEIEGEIIQREKLMIIK